MLVQNGGVVVADFEAATALGIPFLIFLSVEFFPKDSGSLLIELNLLR